MNALCKIKNPMAKILPVKGGASGITVFIHDDGNIKTARLIDRLLEEHSLVADVALLGRYVYDIEKGEELPVAKEWRELFREGRWKISSHSMKHTYWGNITENGDGTYTLEDDPAAMDYEIVYSQRLFREMFPGMRALTFSYPGFGKTSGNVTGRFSFNKENKLVLSEDEGAINTPEERERFVRTYQYSEAARSLISDTYISGRGGYYKHLNISRGGFEWEYISANNTWSGNAAETARKIDDAAYLGELLIMYTHNIADDEPHKADLSKRFAKISNYVKEGKLWHTHYEDAILYLREAQTATVTAEVRDGGIAVTLIDELPDDIYDMPLTVRVDIDPSVKRVKITQGDRASFADGRSVEGRWVIDAEIVPDRGTAFITAAE